MNVPSSVNLGQYLIINSFCMNNKLTDSEYSINDDGSIDIFDNEPLKILHTYMEDLPVKINKVSGDFTLGSNYNLTTLKNCPKYIGGNVLLYKNTKLPLPVQYFLNENVYNQYKIKTFMRYQNDFDLWTDVFNENNFNELIAEIEEGLQ